MTFAPPSGPVRSARGQSRRRWADLAMVALARLLVHVFFRRVEVEHGERLGSDQPTVLVVNHRNGLVDALLLMAALGRYPRFLGKSTLFRNPLLWPFLKLAGVIPVYRAQDGVSTSRNSDAFAAAHRLLARGDLVAIFPEGISHDQPALQPLRTGAARIALGAVGDGVGDVQTVAVALVYDDKQRFRSRALVRVGCPEPATRWEEEYRRDDHSAVRLLTDDLARQLRQVSPDFASWSEESELAEMAEVVVRPTSGHGAGAGAVDLAERHRITVALAGAGAPDDRAAALAALRRAYDRYRRDLDVLGLSDPQVAAAGRSGSLRGPTARALVQVVAALPFAVLGAVIHVVPYQVVKRAARVPANQGMRATVKVIGCFFTFTIVYVALGVLAGQRFGPLWGVVAAAGAPLCGYLTVRMAERIRRLGGVIQGVRAVRNLGPAFAAVAADRAAAVDAAQVVLGPPGADVTATRAPVAPPSGA
jgi:glycerol-3-phosphate O-acyltransferase/dihydroxyacetone phosphate acyltransferase